MQFTHSQVEYSRALLAQELVQVFDEADNDNNRRPDKPHEEQNREQVHEELRYSNHHSIVNPLDARQTGITLLASTLSNPTQC